MSRGRAGAYYRPEIDGLRAVAIIPVVLFHAGFIGFSGGFVGVDVFFVISGFLITSIMLREQAAGTFSLLSFWERRMRRIMPALALVVFSTAIAGTVIFLYPTDIDTLGKSLVSLSFFLSNIIFLRRDTYFDSSAETHPLLHTWSLAIEEQFYIVFPFLLLLVTMVAARFRVMLFAVFCVASFGYSYYLTNVAPGVAFDVFFVPHAFWGGAENATASFYLLPARAWELLAGVLLALCVVRIPSRWIAEGLSLVGLLLILGAVFFFRAETPFPGVAALLPVVGTVCVIAATTERSTYVSRVLSWWPLVWVGLISYALYLWHWPLLVFARTLFGELSIWQSGALVMLSVIAAWCTHQLVEVPFGQRRIFPKKNLMLLVGVLLLIVFSVVGKAVLTLNPTERMPEYVFSIPENAETLGEEYYRCFRNYGLNKIRLSGPCDIGASYEEYPDFVLWGNSHAGAVAATLDDVATELAVSGTSFMEAGCFPLRDVTYAIGPKPGCEEFVDRSLSYFKTIPPATVLIVANWGGALGDRGADGFMRLTSDSQPFSLETSHIALATALPAVVSELLTYGHTVYVLEQPPVHHNYNPRDVFYSSLRVGTLQHTSELTTVSFDEQRQFMGTVYDAVAAAGGEVVSTEQQFCDRDICYTNADGVMWYRDFEHINYHGANQLTTTFTTLLERVHGTSTITQQ